MLLRIIIIDINVHFYEIFELVHYSIDVRVLSLN